MVLLCDKYHPHTLAKLSYHHELSKRLEKMAAGGDMPHCMFFGPSGAGKRTRIFATLRSIYGPGVEKVKVEPITIEIRDSTGTIKKKLELTVRSSNYHIEVTPSELGYNDRHVIQHFLKDLAQTQQLSSAHKSYKIILVNEADRLSKDAQQALRRPMEKFSTNCRIILCCESASRIIAPVRSRCLPIRVGAPSPSDIIDILNNISKKEKIALPEELANKIVVTSNRNLRRALLMLEACITERIPLDPDQNVPLPSWEVFISELAKLISEEQSPERLKAARLKIYELLINCIPPTIILSTLTQHLCKSMADNSLKYKILQASAFYEHRIQLGSKAIFHIEAFIARYMAIQAKFLMEFMG